MLNPAEMLDVGDARGYHWRSITQAAYRNDRFESKILQSSHGTGPLKRKLGCSQRLRRGISIA